MPPKFRTSAATSPVPETPERLYDELPPRPTRPGALWAHQADVLRTYFEDHLQTPDIALELPTGAGKTIPGLLITDWRRQRFEHPSLYACPTQNLARQTAQAAERVGIRVVSLVGSHTGWSTADRVAYESGEAVAVTTYSSLFNARPALLAPGTVLFDDAHAAESFVAGAWSAEIDRGKRWPLYRQAVELARPTMSGLLVDRLLDDRYPATPAVHLVDVEHVRHVAGALSAALLALGPGEDLYWRGVAIGAHLDRCLVYISWDRVLIRPIIPPTASHQHFTAATQRVYLSATLGAGGELERAFGRAPIKRLPIPEGWDRRGAGRRLFVFPELQQALPPRELAAAIVAQSGKALVLAPSDRDAEQGHDLASHGIPVLGPRGDVDDLLETFRGETRSLLTLAARYDGLDLPDAQCRVTVLDGMPRGAHLQERFFSEILLSGRVLRERWRTRVIQGAGRCSRGLTDYSIVVILGDSLTRFLTWRDVNGALRPELQAEIQFGRANSTASPDELREILQSFLAQDADWFEGAEPDLRQTRSAAAVVEPSENGALATAAQHEVRAAGALWTGDWASASQAALKVAEAVGISSELAGYRAFWTYLAAAWLGVHAETRNDSMLRASSTELLRKAYAAARSTLWLREIRPLPELAPVLDDVDQAAVATATQNGPRSLPAAKWATLSGEVLAALAQTEAKRYERGLVELGRLLGADAYKPTGNGRCDSAWIWQGWWLAVEAKSEQKPSTRISQTTVRQANDELMTLAHDRGQPVPDKSAVLIISPRTLADDDAVIVAAPFVYMVSPDSVLELANEAVAAWTTIRAQSAGLDPTQTQERVGRVFAERGLLPSDLRGRLLNEPIQP